MADNTTYYGDISPRTAAYAAVELQKRGQYILVTERFGQVKPLPRKSSKTQKFRRYESLNRATTPLAEGQTPAGQKLTYTDVQCTLEQYGDFIEITDVIQDTHEDPVLNESIDLIGEQAAETLEVLNVAVIKASTSVYYGGSVASRSLVKAFTTRGQLRKVVRSMKSYKAKFFTQIVKAGPKTATEPIGPCFWCMSSTDLESDIRDLPGFVPIEKYSDADQAIPGEVGKVENIRFVCTPLFEPWADSGAAIGADGKISTTGANNDVYPMIIVAPNSYGVVPLKGKNSITPMVINPEKPSKSDPLGQRGYVSWKTYHSALILNDNWIYRIEVAATDNPT